MPHAVCVYIVCAAAAGMSKCLSLVRSAKMTISKMAFVRRLLALAPQAKKNGKTPPPAARAAACARSLSFAGAAPAPGGAGTARCARAAFGRLRRRLRRRNARCARGLRPQNRQPGFTKAQKDVPQNAPRFSDKSPFSSLWRRRRAPRSARLRRAIFPFSLPPYGEEADPQRRKPAGEGREPQRGARRSPAKKKLAPFC